MKKKNKIWIYSLIFMGLVLILTYSCKKSDDNPDPSESITDSSGNVYHTVTLGTQTWMVENLRTTKYNDNIDIPIVSDDSEWGALSDPAYCWYNNEIANKDTYGALYNWYTVNSNKLCPTGWHVPTRDNWITLITYLTDNGYDYRGGTGDAIAKSMAAKSGWTTSSNTGGVGNNQASNNSSGFTAVPAGFRWSGTFSRLGGYNYLWTATEVSTTEADNVSLWSDGSFVWDGYDLKTSGFSVRCLKNN
jgi:uncharacterized protein (TIGR02145 family)